MIASHAKRDAPAVHPCQCIGASWSAVDQVAKCEEAVALRCEADMGQHGLEGQELAVHVSYDGIAAVGAILPYPHGGQLQMGHYHHSQLPLVVLGSAMGIGRDRGHLSVPPIPTKLNRSELTGHRNL